MRLQEMLMENKLKNVLPSIWKSETDKGWNWPFSSNAKYSAEEENGNPKIFIYELIYLIESLNLLTLEFWAIIFWNN